MPAPANAVRQSTLGGVRIYYERARAGDPWGDMAGDEATSALYDPKFLADLDATFDILFSKHLSKPTGIITAGVFTEKPGAHGLARAFDLDGLVWRHFNWRATQYEKPGDTELYCALMCFFSRHFGNVLGWEYNNAHKDHIHIDNMVQPGFRYNSRAVVTTIQSALKYIFLKSVNVDGDWGLRTQSAMASIVPFKGVYPTNPQYFEFLNRAAETGFSLGFPPVPLASVAPAPQPPSSEEQLIRVGSFTLAESRTIRAEIARLEQRAKEDMASLASLRSALGI